MGYYSEYLKKQMNFNDLTVERKKHLKEISKLRAGRDIIVYASDLTNKTNAVTAIDYSDILPFQDQLANLNGKAIDVILETPGGIAEVVEDLVRLVRSKYDHVGIIIPGTAKSAGTIFTMAGDEILMGVSSSLGPIDAQMITANKRFSAEAFLEGLEKIKSEVLKVGKLNPAYIPILQNISPGEIQHCENAQNFSKILVTQWLSKYKFKYWDKHSKTGDPVTSEEKEKRAKEIADKLCKHSDWLTHSRSINIEDLEKMGLKITDYSKDANLNEAINRYFTLLRMTLESSNVYKLFETIDTQVLRFSVPQVQPGALNPKGVMDPKDVIIGYVCPQCRNKFEIQAILDKAAKIDSGKIKYPKNDTFICPNCRASSNLAAARLQVEAQTGKKIILT
jgi:hypothetical protein